MIKNLITKLQCKLGYHSWGIPVHGTGKDSYKRYGTRRCRNCGREEFATIHKGTGVVSWVRTDE